MFDFKEKEVRRGVITRRALTRAAFLSSASTLVLTIGVGAYAQDGEVDEIIVTGIRSSLEKSADIKRNASGVVDAITAEDIGKFPDTNLAESLQRITGVSINRVNGEGSQVTVRGFGAEFNLVTLNGRTLPGADVPLAGTNRSGAGGNTRAFDFSNLASESVSGIEVYKTGKSTLPSGGIGATVNIQTARPLDRPGLRASFGAKGVVDTSVVNGNDITPEINGLLSWTDDTERFGIGLFGSYQDRDSAAASSSVATWQISRGQDFLDNGSFVNDSTNLVNAPNPDQLVGIPTDSRYHFSELERERLNGQAVLQFAPTETLTLTADALYARNDNSERRSDVSNWFGAVFTEAIFDGNDEVATPTSLSAVYSGTKDFAVTQDEIATRDELESFGFNAEWEASDAFSFVLDAHTSTSSVTPRLNSTAAGPTGSPLGAISRVEVGAAAPFVESQTQTFSDDGIPQQSVVINSATPDGVEGFSITDVSTTVAQIFSTRQENQVDEIDLRGAWAIDPSTTLTAGVNFRAQENVTDATSFQQILGFWDAGNPGDIADFAPNVLEAFCLTCEFDDFDTGIPDDSETGQGFRGSALELFDAVSPAYAALEGTDDDPVGSDNTIFQNGSTFSTVEEDIFSVFAEFQTTFDVAGRDANLNIGLRYEDTQLTSTSVFQPVSEIQYISDNDFAINVSPDATPIGGEFSYDNLLPNIDFNVDVTEDVVVRASYSQTIARAGFGSLIATGNVAAVPGPTVFGNIPTATSGNPRLLPLQSDNFDVSAEWYYDDASFVSVGLFHKRVDNFLGSGSINGPLFGLRDVTSGADGSRSGRALELLADIDGASSTPRNLFTLLALLESNSEADAIAQLTDNLGPNGEANDALFIGLSNDVSIAPNADDPLFDFSIAQDINNNVGEISGVELALQHFFGDTGFGIAGSYTYVDGDVAFDVTEDPGNEQFALTGLSDTANITLIYENYGFSARGSYNWRDEFLASADIGDGNRNPSFVESFGQFDLNLSYDVAENFAVSVEAINLTGENIRIHGRSDAQLQFAQELQPRFLFGARYTY